MNGRVAKALRREVLGKDFKRGDRKTISREPKVKDYKILKEIYKNTRKGDI